MSISFKEAPFGSELYKATLVLREEVLRKPIGMALREKDTELDHTEFHLVAMENDSVIACVSLRPISEGHIKLRQMAVADSH